MTIHDTLPIWNNAFVSCNSKALRENISSSYHDAYEDWLRICGDDLQVSITFYKIDRNEKLQIIVSQSSDDGNISLAPPFRVGEFVVRPDLNQLIHDDLAVSLEPRVMQVLVYLSYHRGDVVSRQQLKAAVWQDPLMGDDSLNRAISDLRSALDDDSTTPNYIETIRKVGYRLIAPVATVESEDRAPGAQIVPELAGDALQVVVFFAQQQEQSLAFLPQAQALLAGEVAEVLHVLAKLQVLDQVVVLCTPVARKDGPQFGGKDRCLGNKLA